MDREVTVPVAAIPKVSIPRLRDWASKRNDPRFRPLEGSAKDIGVVIVGVVVTGIGAATGWFSASTISKGASIPFSVIRAPLIIGLIGLAVIALGVWMLQPRLKRISLGLPEFSFETPACLVVCLEGSLHLRPWLCVSGTTDAMVSYGSVLRRKKVWQFQSGAIHDSDDVPAYLSMSKSAAETGTFAQLEGADVLGACSEVAKAA